MTTTNGTPASTASTTAALANFGGTNTTDTSAPVASTASLTLPNTGTAAPSNSTDCPPLPGVTPPTIAVPEFSIRWVCRRPSDPVMPWTITFESPVRKMAISVPHFAAASSATRRAAPSMVSTCSRRGAAHRAGSAGPHRRCCRPAGRPADGDLVASASNIANACTMPLATSSHAVIPPNTLTKTLVRRVGQDDLQPVCHHLRRSAAADVEKLAGFMPWRTPPPHRPRRPASTSPGRPRCR